MDSGVWILKKEYMFFSFLLLMCDIKTEEVS